MALKIENIRKSYGDLNVLDGVSFDVREGEILCIVGESGCGKTTLLKIIAGIEKADSGDLSLKNGRIGFVFQDVRLLPWKTVLGNIEFVLESMGMDKSKAGEMIKLVGLEGFENYYPKHLSGGMQQRVGIARAIAIDPDLLLMDEPFANLDALTKERMQSEILKIIRDKTVIFVTHDIDEAVYLADRIVVLSKRPAKVVDIIDIDLPKPRDRVSEKFLEYKRRIYNLL